MIKNINRVQVSSQFVQTVHSPQAFLVALLVTTIFSIFSPKAILAAEFPANPTSEEDCSTVLSERAGVLYHWYTNKSNLISERSEVMENECWEEYTYQAEDAKSIYDSDLQFATLTLLGALAACERVARACFMAGVVEPGVTVEAICAAKIAACVAAAWAYYYVEADKALVGFRNAMDTAYRTRDACSTRVEQVIGEVVEAHTEDYFRRWTQLQKDYDACVSRISF